MPTVEQYRPEGARNWIRVGDLVKVTPSRPGKHDGGQAPLSRITVDDAGANPVFDVYLKGKMRSVTLERIQRVAQTHHGEDRPGRKTASAGAGTRTLRS